MRLFKIFKQTCHSIILIFSYPNLILIFSFLETLKISIYLQGIGAPEYSVRFEDILSLTSADTVVLKVDIEGYECKVRQH